MSLPYIDISMFVVLNLTREGAGAGAVEGDPYGDNVSDDDADMNSKSPAL